ncbi:Pkinase domain containing protein [Hyaloscypha variabilis]
MDHHHRASTRRAPLGEATRRVNNELPQTPSKISTPRQHERQKPDLPQVKAYRPPSPARYNDYDSLRDYNQPGPLRPNPENPRLSAISKEHDATNSRRDSLFSTTSTESSRVKVYIGPWRLGKTLGEGATARVRLAKHASTGQWAAVKIVQKRYAQLSQASSLADLDQSEALRPDAGDGLRRMPVGIEREVAIMKLIQHPNIMKLYDIWENRKEIYLVLEYVNNGELFDYITRRAHGLEEETALMFFRQILSAVGYCHSFNICHRDLKPENILLTKDLEIKIADFGMAALHQSPDHRLKTSCGSPHYAAPELIKGNTYRGNQADIWSLGVILYAMLSGILPFDVETDVPKSEALPVLLKKIQRGRFEMRSVFSEDAKDLIRRMLQVNPQKRITLREMWRHPLLRKYDYLDNLASGSIPESPNTKACGRPVFRRSEIDKELLRHLRSLWHGMSEQQLIDALLNEKANEQKLFYSLLLKYRDAQLENYTPDLEYSNSDYHHVRPLNLKKTYSTCQFPQAKSNGHGRQVSKFTVVSNAAETVRSYDPFKASRPQHLNNFSNDNQAKITIHRPDTINSRDSASRYRSASGTSSQGTTRDRRRLLPPPTKLYTSRSSMASTSTRSRASNPYVRATIGHKRGVSFSNLRKHSFGEHSKDSSDGNALTAIPRHSNHTEVTDDGGSILRLVAQTPASTRYIQSRKTQCISQPILPLAKRGPTSQIWNEDVRQLSTNLAKDCDEAFNRTSIVSNISERSEVVSSNEATRKTKPKSLRSRPLPEPPARTQSVKNELLEARKQAELRKMYPDGDESPTYLNRMVSHIDRLMQPISPTRSFSAPTESKKPSARLLPSIQESHEKDMSPFRAKELAMYRDRQRRPEAKTGARIGSAPEPRELGLDSFQDRSTRPDYLDRDTIRVVDPTSTLSPVRPPAPLVIRKKSSKPAPLPLMSGGLGDDMQTQSHNRGTSEGLNLRQQYNFGANDPAACVPPKIEEGKKDEDSFMTDSNASTILRKTSGWFKRSSRSGGESGKSTAGSDSWRSHSSHGTAQEPYPRPHNPHLDSSLLPPSPQKKISKLGRWFKKRKSKPNMSLGVDDTFNDTTSIHESFKDRHYPYLGDPKARQIAPQQNWLAKLFKVKPVSKHLCFSVTKRRARQEIARVLKEWKRYGLEDVQIDKARNIVFGRVALGNYFHLKEVSFAAEIMTVIEHGKKSKLSIARFTQESGAASSFNQVVETMETVLKSRRLLVTDDRKKRMMIKTLNAAS